MNTMKPLDYAARAWGGQAALHLPNGDVRTGDPGWRNGRRPPSVPTPDEIANWKPGNVDNDLNQMVTDSGAIPAGTTLWSNIPHGLWYPNGSPAGDVQALINGQVFDQFEPVPPTPPVAS
jgi:hypothetical protein